MARVLGIGAAILIAIVAFFAFTGDEGEAGTEQYPEARAAMIEEVRAMPGYEADPATFEQYFDTAHPKAVAATFVEKRLDPHEPDDFSVYVGEVYRQMLDQAFTESRTDLADILTRAYMAVVREP